MIQLWPGGISCSSPCSCSSASITMILSWHPWGCVGVQPQRMLSLTENHISQKIVFPLPEIARGGSGGTKLPEERNNCPPPSAWKAPNISVWARMKQGLVWLCVGCSPPVLGGWNFLQVGPGGMEVAPARARWPKGGREVFSPSLRITSHSHGLWQRFVLCKI